jgi:hypothetical protein
MRTLQFRLFAASALLAGVYLLFFGIQHLLANSELAQKFERTIGRVSAYGELGDGKKYPVILFISQDSQKVYYKAIDKKVKKGMETGDETELFYDLINPSDVRFRAHSNAFLYFCLCIGAVFSLTGAWFLLNDWRKKRMRKRLEQNGKKISALVSGIGFLNKGIGQSGHYFVIDCSWQRHDGKSFSFRSEPLSADPSSIYPVGSSISVLIDVNNPANYWIEI